jgi:hypothetical protein
LRGTEYWDRRQRPISAASCGVVGEPLKGRFGDARPSALVGVVAPSSDRDFAAMILFRLPLTRSVQIVHTALDHNR